MQGLTCPPQQYRPILISVQLPEAAGGRSFTSVHEYVTPGDRHDGSPAVGAQVLVQLVTLQSWQVPRVAEVSHFKQCWFAAQFSSLVHPDRHWVKAPSSGLQ
jgi:hypothetical protein